MQEATIVEQLREKAGVDLGTVRSVEGQAAILIERQQQVIDLLMKAVEPFADADDDDLDLMLIGSSITSEHLRRAREAKVEAERILNHSHPGLEREKE